MDIVRSKKQNKFKNKISGIAGLAIFAFVAIAFLLSYQTGGYQVNKDSLLIDQVQRGQLNVNVRGVGVLVPKDERWVASNVEGKVDRIHIKAGAKVRLGDLLLELSNPQLEQRLEQQKWELEELEAQTNAQEVTLESNLLDQEASVINEKLNYDRARLTLTAQQQLLSQGIVAVSKIDFEETKIEVDRFKQRWELEKKRLVKRKENLAAQRKAYQASLNRMRKVVQSMQEQVDGLKVRASMDSIVQEMPMELGQQVATGTNLARLARQGEFMAEIRVPEKQMHEVMMGQTVVIDTRTSQVKGSVKRIDPVVVNGTVQVDVELIGAAPKESRPDLTVDGIIEINQIDNALFVKRPMFAKANSEAEVYLLDKAGQSAVKKAVKFGQMSSKFIQIERGLNAGENIIVSDVSSWAEEPKISLN